MSKGTLPVTRSSNDNSPVAPVARQAEAFSFEVRELYGRWRVEENGESVAAFESVEDAVPLALLYAHARNEAGNPAIVFVQGEDGGKVRLAQFGALKPFSVAARLAS